VGCRISILLIIIIPPLETKGIITNADVIKTARRTDHGPLNLVVNSITIVRRSATTRKGTTASPEPKSTRRWNIFLKKAILVTDKQLFSRMQITNNLTR